MYLIPTYQYVSDKRNKFYVWNVHNSVVYYETNKNPVTNSMLAWDSYWIHHEGVYIRAINTNLQTNQDT